MRICIVAEHASYRFGGQGVLPLHYFSRLRARGVDVWLVVHARTREELQALFPADQSRIRYIENAWFHRFLDQLNRLFPARLGEFTIELLNQLITQHLERKIVLDLIRREGVNVVHQPIPVSPRFPSLMTGLGVPVVIGPMNGGMEYPPPLRHRESILSRLAVWVGRRLSGLAHSTFPGKRRANILLVANERTKLALPAGCAGEVIEFLENGVDLTIWFAGANGEEPDLESTEKRFVFVGRLVEWKGVDMAIEALVQVPEAHLEIIGEGPMRRTWESLAQKRGVAERVSFAGWLPQKECAARLRHAAALVLPSILECGGAVVLEAMAVGKPVIAVAWGGPADYLDEHCGLLITPASREKIVKEIARSFRRLIADPELARRLGMNGRLRALTAFDWERKIDRILDIYDRASGPSLQSTSGVCAPLPDQELLEQ